MTSAGVGGGAHEPQVFVMSGTIAIKDGVWKDVLGLRWLELQQLQQQQEDGETKTGDFGVLSVRLEFTCLTSTKVQILTKHPCAKRKQAIRVC